MENYYKEILIFLFAVLIVILSQKLSSAPEVTYRLYYLPPKLYQNMFRDPHRLQIYYADRLLIDSTLNKSASRCIPHTVG